ncbi:hypothetical protein ACIA8C_13320 [Nocardia sp. NPDC051321]|uniref:hypothetical protein n=1 Tax=Nocardia sp. NPDC051321 TaxID=3364323 RepID=UPI00378A4A9A
MYEVDAAGVAARSLAVDLIEALSLEQAEQRTRARRGYSDIDTERNRHATRREPRAPTTETIGDIDRYRHNASRRGVNALTLRRVIELTGATGADAGNALRKMLEHERPDNMRPPLYLV